MRAIRRYEDGWKDCFQFLLQDHQSEDEGVWGGVG